MTVLRSGLKIGPKLGNGHFGEVFRATDPVRGEVAVKILRQTPLETSDQWQCRKIGLLKEGVRLRAAKHKNVVEVIQFLETDDGQEILLVMELCRGGSLQPHFENGPIRLSTAKNIATNIALGLQTLHLRGMLHRDIKPANLLLDENGVLKLGDFGLVTDELILGYGAQAGYTDHIAYEVWNGSGTSARSDIWAAGMTIYRLLHGANWYQRSQAPRHIIRHGKFADTLKWLPHIPQHWRRLIRKTLQDNPHSRYETATKFFNALSPLPCVQPEWKCTVNDEVISWSKQIKDRIHQVEWKKEDNDKYSWSAWSEPILIGKRRTLGASSEPSTYNITDGQLQKFFRP